MTAILITFCSAADYGSKDLLNKTNFASYFRDYLGFLYDSHGCLHFTPSDIYLLYRTVKKGTPLIIRSYSDKALPFQDKSIAFFDDVVMDEKDIDYYASLFSSSRTSLVVFPSFSRLYIFLDNRPYVKVPVQAGPPYDFTMLEDVVKNKPLDRDFMTATPTDTGRYKILGKTDHYISPTYPEITKLAFGTEIKYNSGIWTVKRFPGYIPAPRFIQEDLLQQESGWRYNYYDISRDNYGNILSLRWAGHDFGKYVIYWTRDGRARYPEIGYCSGELLFEQYKLVGSIANILTMDGPLDIEGLAVNNLDFSSYKNAYDFISTSGRENKMIPEEAAFYRLFHDMPLTNKDRAVLDPRLEKAYLAFKSRDLPQDKKVRRDTLSLYNYLRIYNKVIEKNAGWYGKMKADWGFWVGLREKLINDFEKNGVPQKSRKKIVEKWINSRLEFKTIK